MLLDIRTCSMMTLQRVPIVSMRRYLYGNIRNPQQAKKFVDDTSEEEDEEYIHPAKIITDGTQVKASFTLLSSNIKPQHFKDCIGVTLVTLDSSTKCDNIVLNADNVYLIVSSTNYLKINPRDYMSLEYIATPVLYHKSLSSHDHSKPFSLYALYIHRIL